MPTTKNLLVRFTFSTGLGLAVLAGGSVAAGAAPPDSDAPLDERPAYGFEFDRHLDLRVDPPDEPVTIDPRYVDPDFFDPYPGLDMPHFTLPEPIDDSGTPPGRRDRPDVAIPDIVVDVDPDLGIDPDPIVPVDPCVLTDSCPPADIPEDTPKDTPEDTPDETPDETPEDTPDETPEEEDDDDTVVPSNKGSLAFTGAGSVLLAAIGTGVAGAGVAVHRLSRRMKR